MCCWLFKKKIKKNMENGDEVNPTTPNPPQTVPLKPVSPPRKPPTPRPNISPKPPPESPPATPLRPPSTDVAVGQSAKKDCQMRADTSSSNSLPPESRDNLSLPAGSRGSSPDAALNEIVGSQEPDSTASPPDSELKLSAPRAGGPDSPLTGSINPIPSGPVEIKISQSTSELTNGIVEDSGPATPISPAAHKGQAPADTSKPPTSSSPTSSTSPHPSPSSNPVESGFSAANVSEQSASTDALPTNPSNTIPLTPLPTPPAQIQELPLEGQAVLSKEAPPGPPPAMGTPMSPSNLEVSPPPKVDKTVIPSTESSPLHQPPSESDKTRSSTDVDSETSVEPVAQPTNTSEHSPVTPSPPPPSPNEQVPPQEASDSAGTPPSPGLPQSDFVPGPAETNPPQATPEIDTQPVSPHTSHSSLEYRDTESSPTTQSPPSSGDAGIASALPVAQKAIPLSEAPSTSPPFETNQPNNAAPSSSHNIISLPSETVEPDLSTITQSSSHSSETNPAQSSSGSVAAKLNDETSPSTDIATPPVTRVVPLSPSPIIIDKPNGGTSSSSTNIDTPSSATSGAITPTKTRETDAEPLPPPINLLSPSSVTEDLTNVIAVSLDDPSPSSLTNAPLEPGSDPGHNLLSSTSSANPWPPSHNEKSLLDDTLASQRITAGRSVPASPVQPIATPLHEFFPSRERDKLEPRQPAAAGNVSPTQPTPFNPLTINIPSTSETATSAIPPLVNLSETSPLTPSPRRLK